ncbi:NAD-dependent epimerase/dehydratase family protein [Candidatus Woesearchaeota archaeon]|nr:NAD-dependent epimerase/dehydratase family protein [Candidatus Woesearchaeota archaeon]
MKVLVTGGSGFVGSNLASYFDKNNEVITTFRNQEQKLSGFKGKIVNPEFSWKKLGSIDVLFHEAAIADTTVTDETVMNAFNVEYSKRLFENAINHGCKKIIYATSTAVYGDVPAPYKENGPKNPLNAYGKSKLLLEEFATEFAKDHPNILVVGLRYCNVYGPGESHKGNMASMIYQLAQQHKKGQYRLFKWGKQKRDFIYVKDVIRANELALNSKESCVLNCGYGAYTTFNEVTEILNLVLGKDVPTEFIDNPYEKQYQEFTECDMSLAEENIGFVPKYNVAEGIKDYYLSGKLV